MQHNGTAIGCVNVTWLSSRPGGCPGRPWNSPGASQVWRGFCQSRWFVELDECRGTQFIEFELFSFPDTVFLRYGGIAVYCHGAVSKWSEPRKNRDEFMNPIDRVSFSELVELESFCEVVLMYGEQSGCVQILELKSCRLYDNFPKLFL